jgi:hypothetical protein
MNVREQIRQDAAFNGTYGGLYGGAPYPYGVVPHYGHPATLQDLGFGNGKYASELSQLRFRSGAERGVYTAAEESEKLLERYRRERHIFTPMQEEINIRQTERASGKSMTLEPVKSVATRVSEQRKLEERLVHRSYNPYFAGALPANAMGYHGGEMRLAHEKTTQDELATFSRARAVEGDPRGTRGTFRKHHDAVNVTAEDKFKDDAIRHKDVLNSIHAFDMKAQEDALRHKSALAPAPETLSQAYAFRYSPVKGATSDDFAPNFVNPRYDK